jgi:murein DD-endopeptidase MepM/ murein hydrolase activator NlpD
VVRTRSHHDKACWERGCGRYANFIVILHADGTTGEYYHLARDGVAVAEGETVNRGQLIGYSGNTGRSTMPHLHFGVYRATTWGRTESVPVQFVTHRGAVRGLKPGQRYRWP